MYLCDYYFRTNFAYVLRSRIIAQIIEYCRLSREQWSFRFLAHKTQRPHIMRFGSKDRSEIANFTGRRAPSRSRTL